MTFGKNKMVFAAFFVTLLFGVLCVAVAAGLSGGGLAAVDFTCNAGSEYAFVFSVEVNLSDGLNSFEAIDVAASLFEVEMNHTNYEVKSVQPDSEGDWTVYLLWGAVTPKGEMENHSHYYNVHINASDRTVSSERCY